MRHRILTCKNHPELRWGCKDIAWDDGGYNGSRNLFYHGTPTGQGMFPDGSGLWCSVINAKGEYVGECSCPTSELILAPEDSLVTA